MYSELSRFANPKQRLIVVSHSIGQANVLKSTIRQAMKYGTKPEVNAYISRSACLIISLKNPLRFQLPGIADGESLKTAAEQMSYAFLTSGKDVHKSPTLNSLIFHKIRTLCLPP